MRRGVQRWMLNWVLCVLCVCVFPSSYDYLKGVYPNVCVCIVSRSMFHVIVCGYLKRPLSHLRASSLPSSWHLSLGRASCGVSLIKASTVWLMNRLCGISAPGWRSHSAAPRLLWGPPFHWALNQETALITLPPSSSLSSTSSLSLLFLPHFCVLLIFPFFLLPTLSLRSTALFRCPSYLPVFFLPLPVTYNASSLG